MRIIKMKKRVPVLLAVVLIAWFIYLLSWPVSIEPQAWQPDLSPGFAGQFEPNHYLANIEKLTLSSGEGPEDVAVDEQGRIYAGLQDGRIVRFDINGQESKTFANTGGRPLGLHFDRQGNLIVADAYKGLLAINAKGEITVLTIESEGLAFRFTNDLEIADNGIIYFSDASYKYTQAEYKMDALEHQPNGRLLAYDPATKQTYTLLKDLYFANGVAVSADQSFVLVNETWNYRILRYWLNGEKKGQSEIFIEHLPGFPDGISSDGKGTFWLAMASPRNPMMDNLAPYPFLRKVIQRLPKFMHPAPVRYAFVLGLDQNGEIIYNLQEPSGEPFSVITSVQAKDNMLYLGSLEESAIGKIPMP